VGAVLLLAIAVLTSGPAMAEFDLTELMAMLAKVERSSVAFEETRYLAVLAAPIVRRGTLNYVRPDHLEMHVVTPFPETVDVTGNRMRIQAPEQKTRELDLGSQPVALAWIEGIRASLAGDAAALRRLYRVTMTGTPTLWRMALEPVEPRVATALRRIDVTGRQTQIDTIEILDQQGDRVAIRLQPVARSAP
jgi:outer membrane lipoprotein-sorting protein